MGNRLRIRLGLIFSRSIYSILAFKLHQLKATCCHTGGLSTCPSSSKTVKQIKLVPLKLTLCIFW